jgi:hypothetical protein
LNALAYFSVIPCISVLPSLPADQGTDAAAAPEVLKTLRRWRGTTYLPAQPSISKRFREEAKMTKKRLCTAAGLILLVQLVLAGPRPSLGEEPAMSRRLKEVESLFNNFNRETLHLADAFYDPDVVFQDPIVELRGLDALKAYYADMYESVLSIRFDFSDEIEKDEEVVVFWTMELRAKGLKGGDPVVLDGASHIKFGGDSGKAIYHRDYFDMGAFVYENVPVLGSIVRYTKRRLSRHGNE